VPIAASIMLGVLVYVVLRPVAGFGHEIAVAALAWLAHAFVSTDAWRPVLGAIGLDPISSTIQALGGVRVLGIAVAGPSGALLHSALPAVFIDPSHVQAGAGASMVAAAGAPPLGRALASFGANVAWLSIGLWLFWYWRARHAGVALLGLMLQAQIAVNHLLDAQVSAHQVESAGLTAWRFAANGAGRAIAAVGQTPLSSSFDLWFGWFLVVLGYMCAAALLLALVVPFRSLRNRDVGRSTGSTRRSVARPARGLRATLATMVLAVLTALSPVGALAIGESNWDGPARAPVSTHSIAR
jgi:hypothetical protein